MLASATSATGELFHMRYMTGLVILIAASMACSRDNNRVVSTSPTSPTSATAETTISYVGGVSGPMDVLFPPRNESFVFRNNLETKYATSLGRAPVGVFIDKEGEVVWLQEYIRYRTNGCDHVTAMARVLVQIAGGPAGGVCAPPPAGVINFPPRTDILDARRQLELAYQQAGRGLSPTSVDAEGSAVWITEYLRYRTNGCSHAEAEAKVFAQIDGGPVAPLCVVPTACAYVVNPSSANASALGGTLEFEVRPPTAETIQCGWSAQSTVPWLTFPSSQSTGGGFSRFSYNLAQNNGSARTGHIDFAWQGGGSARYTVNQSESQFTARFAMVDSFRSVSETDECWFRSTNTPCTFTATANLPGNGAYTYKWAASYSYGTVKTATQENTSNTFGFVDTCGGSGSTTDGVANDLQVTVTITDSLGNTITLRSGEGNQPALRVRLFTC
jgi:hypothetical protein